MKKQQANIGARAAIAPEPVIGGSGAIRFPKVYAAIKWAIVASLTLLAILAAAFWTLILGGFAGSGFHASSAAGGAGESVAITPECAWPYRVNDPDANAICRMFYNLTPEQRARALKARK